MTQEYAKKVIPNLDILKQKTIAIIGCGGTGSNLLNILCKYEFKTIILIDDDKIEKTNLGRQLYFEKDVGQYKSEILCKRFLEFNPNIIPITTRLNKSNLDLLKGIDLIIDATDNNQTRLLLNNYCLTNSVPWVYSAVSGECFQFCLVNNMSISSIVEKENRMLSKVGIVNFSVISLGTFISNYAIKFLSENLTKNDINKLIRFNFKTLELLKIDI